jgi:ubiquinone biosynthesis monooxygenase Coq7
LDATLRAMLAPTPARAAMPQPDTPTTPLSAYEKEAAGALMRVNHVGEVCAQALYTAQALGARVFSRDEALAHHFEAAANEEGDHLAWTRQRMTELGARPSLLNPLWYAGAFGIGLLASRVGTAASLGFVVETERQVEAHLDSHLQKLPAHDHASRAVVTQMRDDEIRHARQAQQAGAAEVPLPVKWLMKGAAKVMTTVAHRI